MVLNDEIDDLFVSRDERVLYALDAGTKRNCKDSSSLVKVLLYEAIAALRAF